MAAPVPNPTPPELRRCSIRLPRPLWIGVAAVLTIGAAVGLSIGVPIYRQRAAVSEINRRGGGGQVRYDGPQWLRDLLGYEQTRVLEVLVVVRLGGTDFGDDDMRLLTRLGTVEHVVLYNTRVTDAALVQLRHMRQLKRLYLHGTQVTDAGIKSLAALPALKVLDLSRTNITDAGLGQLREMKTLDRLYITDTQVTDLAVADLQAALPRLTITR